MEDEDHSPALVFRVDVRSETGYPLFMAGRYNTAAGTLSYALVHRGVGRIYALDLGAEHRNPDGTRVGETHKHVWQDGFRDRRAYAPDDITEPWTEPVEVWKQFCREASIRHTGLMTPPGVQEELPS